MGVETQTQELAPTKVPPAPFKLAYKFVLLFLVVYFARPEDWVPGIHYLHLAKVLGIVAILAFLGELGSARGKWPREVVYLFLLLGQMFLSVPFSPIWRGGAFNVTRGFANVVPMILVIALAVNTLPRLRRILFWQAASVAVIAPVAIVKFRNAGGRLEGVLNGNYSNSNDLALTIVIVVPVCLAFMLRTRNKLFKMIWFGCIAVMTYAIVLTASRAGILAFAIAMGLSLWHFSIKGRHRFLLVLFGGMAACALLAGGGQLKKRYEAIFNPLADQGAYTSSQQRTRMIKKSIELTFEYPIFGIGPGNFNTASGAWLVTHNSYTQISSETGLPGFILYMMILGCAWRNCSRARRMTGGKTELNVFAVAIQASLVAFLVGSFFASEGYQYFTYFLIAYTTAVYQIAKRQSHTTTPVAQTRQPIPEEFREQPRETAWSTL
jgi:putative inorganic carbon (hco3(-)) transporter